MNSEPGESPGQKIARIVRMYAGASAKNARRLELAELIARGVDPTGVVDVTTNCGMFALGVFNRAGVRHPKLDARYLNPDGRGLAPGANAIARLREIGRDKGALIKWTGARGPQPKLGALVRYNTAGKNDDHVEFMLSDVDMLGQAEHGGGGRQDNAITVSKRSLVTWSSGRPLVEFWDPDALGIEVVALGSDVNTPGAYPDKKGEL